MIIPKQIKKMNERIGASLGRNPHGEPLYKWVHSEDFWHWMRDITGYESVTMPSGLIVQQPIYKRRKMMPHYHDVWLIAHWHEADNEVSWRIKYGADALWPREGYWTPVDAWAEQGQLPTETKTDKFIELVQIRRAMTQADIAKEGQDIQDRIDKHAEDEQDAAFGDAVPAFGALPGSRSSSTSFPSVGAALLAQ